MIKKFQLKNGLTVLLAESHKSPVVSVQMWVNTGSADEAARLRGISHFIEHLVFKGSQKYKVGEIAATVEGSGGELNAYTSFDQTVFHVTISSQFLDTGMDVIAEMMGRPTFDPAEINNEREVVIEEIKRSMDSPHRQANRLLFESLYKHHPYGQPVIGFEEIIRKVQPKEITTYFNQRYGARNMTLLIVGDFEIKELRPKMESHFGHLGNQKIKSIQRRKEPAMKSSRVAVRGANFKENFLFLSWATPAVEHRDIPALEVLAMILGQGDSSRLNQALRIDQTLVNYAGSSLFAPMDPGFFAISASLPPGGFTSCLTEIQNQWQRLITEPVSAEEISKAVINFHSEQYYAIETVDGMARKYGHYEQLFKDYKKSEKFLQQVRAVTAKKLQAIAQKYLKKNKLFACALTPMDQVNERQNELKTWIKQIKFSKASRKKTKKQTKLILPKKWFPAPSPTMAKTNNQVERVQLKNGAVVLLRPNFDTPVLSVRCAFLGGSRIEAPQDAGLNELLSRTWVSATQNKNETELMAAIDNTAGHIGAFGGRNTAGITMSGLKPFAKDLLDLTAEVLLQPVFSSEVFARERDQMLEQLRVRQDNPAQVAILAFNSALFADHPYGRDPLGQPDTLKNLDPEKIKKHLLKMRTTKNLTACVAGHFDRNEVLDYFEKLTSQMQTGEHLLKPIPLSQPQPGVKRFSSSNKEQVHLVLGYPGLKLTDPDRYPLHVLEAVLAGQGGRLFIELRDKNSLAYSVSPLRMEGVEGGYFGAYIGCSPEKGAKSLRMLREELAKISQEKITNEELLRAQRYLIGRHDIDLQKNSAMVAALLFDEIYGIDYRETFRYAERIQAVTKEDVLRVGKRILSSPEVISAVGPREPWEEKSVSPQKEMQI